MKISIYCAILAVAVALAASLGMRPAHAQDVQFTSLSHVSSVVAEQEARIHQLEAQLVSLSRLVETSGMAGDGGCADKSTCDDGCCDDGCCGCGGAFGSAEILFLKPFQSEGIYSDFNYRTGYRVAGGYQRSDGLGLRVSYFDYSQASGLGEFVDISAIDFELTSSINMGCNWNVVVGGGLRYLDYHSGFTAPPDPDSAATFAGYGPTVSAELTCRVSDRLSLFTRVRESIVLADGLQVNYDNDYQDTTGNVFEIQLGVQLNRDWNGATLFARAAWEAQFYTSMDDADSESLALMGGVASIGLQR